MITIQEAAKTLGVTPKTLRLWEKEGKIKSYKTDGGHRRYNLQELLGSKNEKSLTVAYARVSSHKNKTILEQLNNVAKDLK